MTTEYWESTKLVIYSMANLETNKQKVLNAAPSIDAIWVEMITASNLIVMKKYGSSWKKTTLRVFVFASPKILRYDAQ